MARKINNFKEGMVKKEILESLGSRDRIKKNEGLFLTINKLTFEFNISFELVKIIKKCARCGKDFVLKYKQCLYDWCPDCNLLNQQRYKSTRDYSKATVYKQCLICRKKFKTNGLRICALCSIFIDKPENRSRTRCYKIKLNESTRYFTEVMNS